MRAAVSGATAPKDRQTDGTSSGFEKRRCHQNRLSHAVQMFVIVVTDQCSDLIRSYRVSVSFLGVRGKDVRSPVYDRFKAGATQIADLVLRVKHDQRTTCDSSAG